MFIVILKPSTGRVLYSRRLQPSEKKDLDRFANQFARQHHCRIDWAGGPILSKFSRQGDIRIEFRPRKHTSWPLHSGRSYYLVK